MSQNLEHPYRALRVTYGLVPLLAGLDKFTNLLTDWTHYLSPLVARMLPFSPGIFMRAVGIIEIVVGLLVLGIKPRLGAVIAAIWLVAIAVNLVTLGYFDIAVRDLAMAVGAYTLYVLDGERAVRPERTAEPVAAARSRSRATDDAHAPLS
jgi:uncharacterized membrane protein YphA (DoxX/SURF4 family)